MRGELEKLRKSYFGRTNRRLEKTVLNYLDGKLPAEKYYSLLRQFVDKINETPTYIHGVPNLDLDYYPNVASCMSLLDESRHINYRKVNRELLSLLTALRAKLPYQAYSLLLKHTDTFRRSDELYRSIARLSKEYRLNLAQNYPALGRFLAYNERNRSINPVELILEEKRLVYELRVALAEDKGEQDVAFLCGFYNCFEDYLFNRLSSDDHDYFKTRFPKFRQLWEQYASADVFSTLNDDFALLDTFYDVNIRRNECFLNTLLTAGPLLPLREKAGTRGHSPFPLPFRARDESLPQAASSPEGLLKDKRLIVMVTGGFHTRGLQKLLAEKKISYLAITPNVTRDTKEAGRVYQELAREQARFSPQALANQPIAGIIRSLKNENSETLKLDGTVRIYSHLIGALLAVRNGRLDQQSLDALQSVAVPNAYKATKVTISQEEGKQAIKIQYEVNGRTEAVTFDCIKSEGMTRVVTEREAFHVVLLRNRSQEMNINNGYSIPFPVKKGWHPEYSAISVEQDSRGPSESDELKQKFAAFERIIESNFAALSLFKTAMTVEDTGKVFLHINEMIESLGVLNPGQDYSSACNDLKRSFETACGNIGANEVFSGYAQDGNNDNLISSLNGLINSIHSEATRSIYKVMKNGKMNVSMRLPGHTAVTTANVSDSSLFQNGRLSSFPIKLLIKAFLKVNASQLSGFYSTVSNSYIACTFRIGSIHNMEMMANIDDPDNGGFIRVRFSYNSRNKQLLYRTKFIEEVFRGLGMHITNDGFLLKADLNKDTGANSAAQIESVMLNAILAAFVAPNLYDYFLDHEHLLLAEDIYSDSEGLLARTRDIAHLFLSEGRLFEFDKSRDGFEKGYQKYLMSEPQRTQMRKELNRTLAELQLPEIPVSKIFGQLIIDEHFIRPIYEALARGELCLDKDGNPQRNPSYDPLRELISDVIQGITSGEDHVYLSGMLLNAATDGFIAYRQTGYVGDCSAVIGTMELNSGEWLVIHGLRDRKTGRMIFATAGKKDIFSGKIHVLSPEELISLLDSEGIPVPSNLTISSLLKKKEAGLLYSPLPLQSPGGECGRRDRDIPGEWDARLQRARAIYNDPFLLPWAFAFVKEQIEQLQALDQMINENEWIGDIGLKFRKLLRSIIKAKDSEKVARPAVAVSNESAHARDVYPLSSPVDAGGKAAKLSEVMRLIREGKLKYCFVPDGIATATSAFERYLQENGIKDNFDSLVGQLDTAIAQHHQNKVEELSGRIRQLILAGNMDRNSGIGLELFRALEGQGLSGKRFAVRSSGNREDRQKAAFAGMAESYLNVKEDDLLETVKNTWASFWLLRSIEYRAHNESDISQAEFKPAVMIQEMAAPSVSGVMFTMDPVSYEPITVVNASFGPGAIVGGDRGDEYQMHKKTGEEVNAPLLNRKAWKNIPRTDGQSGMDKTHVDAREAYNRCLDPAQLKQLAAVASGIENYFGCPQDIEFAITENGRIAILQTRSVTTSGVSFGKGVIPQLRSWILPKLEKRKISATWYEDLIAPVIEEVIFTGAVTLAAYCAAPQLIFPALLVSRVLFIGLHLTGETKSPKGGGLAWYGRAALPLLISIVSVALGIPLLFLEQPAPYLVFLIPGSIAAHIITNRSERKKHAPLASPELQKGSTYIISEEPPAIELIQKASRIPNGIIVTRAEPVEADEPVEEGLINHHLMSHRKYALAYARKEQGVLILSIDTGDYGLSGFISPLMELVSDYEFFRGEIQETAAKESNADVFIPAAVIIDNLRTPATPGKILFVCNDNTMRSPTAEYFMRDMLEKEGMKGIEVSSRGINIKDGGPVDPIFKEALNSHGINCEKHRARELSLKDAEANDVILCFSAAQEDAILNKYPSLRGKVFTVKAYAGSSDIWDNRKKVSMEIRETIELIVEQLKYEGSGDRFVLATPRGSPFHKTLDDDGAFRVLDEDWSSAPSIESLGCAYVMRQAEAVTPPLECLSRVNLSHQRSGRDLRVAATRGQRVHLQTASGQTPQEALAILEIMASAGNFLRRKNGRNALLRVIPEIHHIQDAYSWRCGKARTARTAMTGSIRRSKE